ncbi:MAG: carbon-nitrogen hydrolase family protein [Planctomycetes bacterium]|nr:carbon-nitrogen hydrolase family protein [Planctomycetota bacterium]
MKETVRVACASIDTKPGQMDENLAKIEAVCSQLSDRGVELVLFQELSLCGFIPNHPVGNHDQWLRRALLSARQLARAVPGEVTAAVQKIASSFKMLISVGLLEDAGNRLFNTQILVGSDGMLGRWRKMHVPMFEMPFYNGCDAPTVVETPLGRIGANICFDSLLPESTRLLAIQNVEIVLFPFAADPPPGDVNAWKQWARTPVSSRCAENGVFGLACNTVGTVELVETCQTFPGGQMIFGPRGELLADGDSQSGMPGAVVHNLAQVQLLTARAGPEYLFRFRRPELYGTLANL